MALKLRRGTNAQRLGITFAEGELVYITDSKKLYIGDGASQGGNLVSGMNNLLEDQTPQLGGNLDLNGNNIIGTGNVNITGSLTVTTGFLAVDTKGSVFANDSGLLVDGIAGKLVLANNALGDLGNVAATAPTDGQVLKWNNSASQWQPQADSTGTQLLNTLTDVNAGSPQNLQALVWDSGTSKWIAGDVVQQGEFLDGDFRGSVFGDDSTLIVDGISNQVTASTLTASSTMISPKIQLERNNAVAETLYTRTNPADTAANLDIIIGQHVYKYSEPSNPNVARHFVMGSRRGIFHFMNVDQNGFAESHVVSFRDGKVGVKTTTPTDTLHVEGSGKFTSSVQFGSLTTTQRDALTAADGMIVYNSTTNKFQGRANGAWVDLH